MAAASLDKILSKFVHIRILDTISIGPSAIVLRGRKYGEEHLEVL